MAGAEGEGELLGRVRSLRIRCEWREDELREAVASRGALAELLDDSALYGDPEVVEALRWSMNQAMCVCDERVEGLRARLRRSEGDLDDALGELRRAGRR